MRVKIRTMEKVPDFFRLPQKSKKEAYVMAEGAKISKAQQKAVHKYVKANYDRLDLTVPKGQKDIIKAHAEARSESVNAFIGRAISETMERDDAGGPTAAPTGEDGILTCSALKAAQEAALAAGECLSQFVARAVETQAQRDAQARKWRATSEPI